MRPADGLLARALNQQWLFLVAAPWNVFVVVLFGESDFSPDSPAQVLCAAAAEMAAAYGLGALVEAALRGLWRALSRRRA